MGETKDPVGEFLDLPEADADPASVGQIGYRSSAFRMRDAIGVFNPRSGGGISEAQHETLRQLIHFIDNGPAGGFASLAYREITGTVFPTAIIWWTSAAKIAKIVEKLITYSGAFPITIQWKMYDTDGVTLLLPVITDAIVYSGAFETDRTRTIV